MGVVAEIRRQPVWLQGLEDAMFQQVLEGEIDGVQVCGLPDRIDPLGDQKYRMIDLKVVAPMKMEDAHKWYYNVLDSRYDIQAALYQYLFAKQQGIPLENVEFYHLVSCSVDKGFAKTRMFKIPQSMMDASMFDVHVALDGIKKRNEFDPVLWKSWDEAETLLDV